MSLDLQVKKFLSSDNTEKMTVSVRGKVLCMKESEVWSSFGEKVKKGYTFDTVRVYRRTDKKIVNLQFIPLLGNTRASIKKYKSNLKNWIYIFDLQEK